MAVCVPVLGLDKIFADALVNRVVDNGLGSASEERILSHIVCQLHGVLEHRRHYGVEEGLVTSTLPKVITV